MNQKNKKVTSIVINDFKNNSRVLKENISLQNVGSDVKVVSLNEESLKEFDKVQNVLVDRIKLKSRNWSKNKLIQLLKYFEFIYRVVKGHKVSILSIQEISIRDVLKFKSFILKEKKTV